MPFRSIPKRGWRVSAVGFGCYRVRSQPTLHREALLKAFRSGINVVDLSGHFGNGDAEEAVGQTLAKAIDSRVVTRDEVVLITKAGFINPSDPRKPPLYSLDPTSIESSLSNSLSRLRTSSVDIFMLNSPERLMQNTNKSSQSQVFEALSLAIEHLETEVSRGRIGSYGIASNTLHLPSSPDFLDLQKYIQERAAVDRQNWVSLEYPFNLFEREAYETRPSQSADINWMSAWENAGFFQFTQRPLNAIASGKLRTLRTQQHSNPSDPNSSENARMELVRERMQKVSSMETELQFSDFDVSSKFIWAHTLAENFGPLADNPFALEYFLSQRVKPALREDIAALLDVAPHMKDWAESYERELTQVSELLVALAYDRTVALNEELLGVLRALVPNKIARSDVEGTGALKNLEQFAIRTAVSALGVRGCTLVGMRTPAYVDSVVNAVKLMNGSEVIFTADDLKHLLSCPLLFY
ncbi:NADP-dependent oxidoreductase domain-containing protein [Cladochytrium replicatum]|nr:NADP-dependent oxidoreductase domain-containing protein [Cladochytrium replicatum]